MEHAMNMNMGVEQGVSHVSRLLEGVSLFGMIGELDQTKTLFTLISLIAILLVFDTFLEMVEYFAEDAGYTGLLQKLYKEMMSKLCLIN
jgi:hypothetical protein